MELSQLLQLEKHVESVIASALDGCCPNVYRSRQTDINASPRVSIKAITGGVFQRQSLPIATPPGWIYSAYEGRLELTIATNRTTESKSDAHYELIGEVRARLQRFAIDAFQNGQLADAAPVLIFDIREGETSDDVADTDDLDMTKITQSILFSINPTALPSNL